MSKQQQPLVDVSVLTEEEKQQALIRARKQMADQWARAELGMAPAEGMTVPKGPLPVTGEEMCPIVILLAEFADRITLDGQVFLHGHTYTVPKRQYDTLVEIMSRTHGHQAQVDGKSENAYRRPQNRRISPAGIQ